MVEVGDGRFVRRPGGLRRQPAVRRREEPARSGRCGDRPNRDHQKPGHGATGRRPGEGAAAQQAGGPALGEHVQGEIGRSSLLSWRLPLPRPGLLTRRRYAGFGADFAVDRGDVHPPFLAWIRGDAAVVHR